MSELADEYLEAYAEHAKTIRTWFVAYGVGAPVLLVTNEAIMAAIESDSALRGIAMCFLVGGALQVLLAALNKFAMWSLYYGETESRFKANWKYKSAHWFSEAMWIDLIIDVTTMLLFGWATWCVFDIAVTTVA